MGQTLWQRLTKGREVVEFAYDNPARARVGAFFDLDVLGHREARYRLRELRVYTRALGGEKVRSVDYRLAEAGKPPAAVLRFLPRPADGGPTHDVLLLVPDGEFPFAPDLDRTVRGAADTLTVTDNATGAAETFHRLNPPAGGLPPGYKATVTVVRDADGNGRADADEVTTARVEYWDYFRRVPAPGGREETEYLVVELDSAAKVHTLFRGRDVDPSRVTVL